MRVARSPACRRVLRAVARRTGAAYSGWSEDAHAAGQHKSPITDALWRQRRAEQELYEAKGVDPDALPPQSQFVARSPQDSAVSIAYDFATNAALRDVYVNCWGELDEGLLFEVGPEAEGTCLRAPPPSPAQCTVCVGIGLPGVSTSVGSLGVGGGAGLYYNGRTPQEEEGYPPPP